MKMQSGKDAVILSVAKDPRIQPLAAPKYRENSISAESASYTSLGRKAQETAQQGAKG